MAKKQTRRSISVSRATYERLKSFCETNNISMSQFVETRVGDFLGQPLVGPSPSPTGVTSILPAQPRTAFPPVQAAKPVLPTAPKLEPRPAPPVIPMTSAAARFAVEPPPPVIKRRDVEEPAPKPSEKRPEQIFTF
jgi:hypothetical protein